MTATLERSRAAAPCKNARQSSGAARDRFLGCLLGGAVGDALGAPVEFMSLDEIRGTFGREGIRDFAPSYGKLGAITDDTQMTLFTAEGLVRGWLRGQTKGIVSYPSIVAHAYLRWLLTQGRRPACELIPDSEGWLYGHRELHHARAPGLTCLGALEEMRGLGDRARNNSKGCGGVMRVAPVGLFAWHWRHKTAPHDDAFDLACELTALTHGHPTGQLAAGAFAVMVLSLACGGSLHDALDIAVGCLKKRPKHEEALQALERARALAKSKLPVTDAIAELGEGWVAEEALAIAVYCALVGKSSRRAWFTPPITVETPTRLVPLPATCLVRCTGSRPFLNAGWASSSLRRLSPGWATTCLAFPNGERLKACSGSIPRFSGSHGRFGSAVGA